MGFWKYAQDDPGYLAIVDPDGTEHAAGDVLARANQVVHAPARRSGLKQGDTVAAVLPNGSHPCTVYLAALQAGFYYVPINYRLSRAGDRVHPPGLRREGVREPRALRRRGERGRRRGGHPAASPPRARHGPRLPPVRRARRPRSPRRCPTTAPPARRCTTRRAPPGKPKGVKRPLADLDPDLSAELFTFLLGLFGITPRRRQRAPVHVAELPHRGHDVRGQLAAHEAHRRVHGQVGPRRRRCASSSATAARTRTWCRRSSSACCSCPTT